MTTKIRNIIHWSLTGVVGILFIGSAMVKLSGSQEATEMAQGIGITATSLKMIGMVELLSVLLFIIPWTGILGTLLLAAYMGGAIATHIVHKEPFIFPAVIQAFVWIVAMIRFPELRQPMFSSPSSKKLV